MLIENKGKPMGENMHVVSLLGMRVLFDPKGIGLNRMMS